MFFAKTFTAAAVLLASLATAQADQINVPQGIYKNDKTHTNVLWRVKHFDLSYYVGRFDDIDATLDLNPDDITKSKLSVKIDPKSVDTNYPPDPKHFNNEIAGEKFFNAAQFDSITFTSENIKVTGEDTGIVEGNLTFHGVTKPVALDVHFNKALNPHPMTKQPAIGFSASTTFKRSDFGVDALVGPVSDDVNVLIEVEFAPQ